MQEIWFVVGDKGDYTELLQTRCGLRCCCVVCRPSYHTKFVFFNLYHNHNHLEENVTFCNVKCCNQVKNYKSDRKLPAGGKLKYKCL